MLRSTLRTGTPSRDRRRAYGRRRLINTSTAFTEEHSAATAAILSHTSAPSNKAPNSSTPTCTAPTSATSGWTAPSNTAPIRATPTSTTPSSATSGRTAPSNGAPSNSAPPIRAKPSSTAPTSTTPSNAASSGAAPSLLTPWERDAGFDQLFSLSRDALVVSELASGRILRWNPAAEQLFGYAFAEVVGRPIELLMPSAVARLHRERIAHYVRTGEVEVLAIRAPLGIPMVTSSGDELRVNKTIAALQAPGSPRGALLLAFRDASCEKELEQQELETARIEAARLESETRRRRCEELLRDTSRAMAAPLARVRRAAARLVRLTEAANTTPPRRLALLTQVVQYRTEDLETAFEQLSDMTDIQTGAFTLSPVRVNLVPLLSRLVTSARGRTAVHRIKFAGPQGLTAHC